MKETSINFGIDSTIEKKYRKIDQDALCVILRYCKPIEIIRNQRVNTEWYDCINYNWIDFLIIHYGYFIQKFGDNANKNDSSFSKIESDDQNNYLYKMKSSKIKGCVSSTSHLFLFLPTDTILYHPISKTTVTFTNIDWFHETNIIKLKTQYIYQTLEFNLLEYPIKYIHVYVSRLSFWKHNEKISQKCDTVIHNFYRKLRKLEFDTDEILLLFFTPCFPKIYNYDKTMINNFIIENMDSLEQNRCSIRSLRSILSIQNKSRKVIY